MRDYAGVWRAMQDFTDRRVADTPDELWLLEHPAVFTLGQAGRAEHVLDPGEIPVIKVDRGGQVTFHGPGQLVAYLLLDLRAAGLGIKRLVHLLEQAVVTLLARLRHRVQSPSRCPGRVRRGRQDRLPWIAGTKGLQLPWPGAERRHGSGALLPHQPLRLPGTCGDPDRGPQRAGEPDSGCCGSCGGDRSAARTPRRCSRRPAWRAGWRACRRSAPW